MNKSYRVIFNHATGVYQCVSEFAKAKGKTKSVKALALASSLVVSGTSFGANIEFTDGQTHTIEGNRAFDGEVLISNPNTKATIKGQLVFGNGDDTNATISNQAVVESNNDIAISAGQNATVVIDNASLANKSGILALGLTPSNTAKLIGRNGAKITASGIVSIASIDNSTATVELIGQDTLLSATIINVGEQAGAKGTLTLSDEANIKADQLLIGRGDKATGTLNANNASIDADSMAAGVYGDGVAKLTSSKLNLSDSYILADGQGSTADVVSVNSAILAQSAVIATTGNANLNSSSDTYRIQKSLIVGQMAGSKGNVNFENNNMSVKDMNLGIFDGSQADVVIKGGDSNFQIDNELIIANGGTGSLTLDKTSLHHVGNVRAGAVYVGGGSDGGTAGTQGGTGTLNLKDSTLVTKEVIVGNTGSGTLRLEAENTDDYLTGLYTNQISRNAGSRLSEIYINGAEIGITTDQPNLFANFTKDNKIELGNKGVYFETANVQSGTNVAINPNAVLTGHVGAININNPDDSAGFWKSGAGTLEINEDSKKFTGDIAVTQGVLKINGNYTMNGENLVIGILDWNEDGVLDTINEHGKLVVTGTADISKGNLKVYAEELIANTTKDSVWRDVVSAGTLNGQFASLDDNSPLVDFEADYSDANKVHLKLKAQDTKPEPQPEPQPRIIGTFENAVNSQTQHSMQNLAQILDRAVADRVSGNANDLADSLIADTINYGQADLANLVINLQPLLSGSVNRIVADSGSAFGSILSTRDFDPKKTVWVKVIGNESNLDQHASGLTGFDSREAGVIVGADTRVDRGNIGLALAYSQNDVDSQGFVNHHADIDTKMAYIYANTVAGASGKTAARAHIGAGVASIEGKRHIINNQIARSNYDADVITASLGVTHQIGTAERHITPFAKIDFIQAKSDGYTETGAGAYGLTVDKATYESLISTVGVRGSANITPRLAITGVASVGLDNGDRRSDISATFAGFEGQRFGVLGHEVGKTITGAGLGISYHPTANSTLSLSYQGQWRDNYDNQGAALGFEMKF